MLFYLFFWLFMCKEQFLSCLLTHEASLLFGVSVNSSAKARQLEQNISLQNKRFDGNLKTDGNEKVDGY